MASTVLQFRVDENLKNESQSIFEQLGLDFPTAFRIFLTRCVEECGLPFEMKVKRNYEYAKLSDGTKVKTATNYKNVSWQDDFLSKYKPGKDKKALKMLSELQDDSVKNGLSEMSMEEIDAEIESYRDGK